MMPKTLIVELANLPGEGVSLNGELDASALATDEIDLVKPSSTLYYDIHVQRFDNELLVRGLLEATLEMTCVRGNHNYFQTFLIEEFAASVEIDAGMMDITDALREELFIEVPTNPNCDEADEKVACEVNSRYFAVDKTPDCDVNEPSEPKTGNQWSNNWDALSGLNEFSDKKDKPTN